MSLSNYIPPSYSSVLKLRAGGTDSVKYDLYGTGDLGDVSIPTNTLQVFGASSNTGCNVYNFNSLTLAAGATAVFSNCRATLVRVLSSVTLGASSVLTMAGGASAIALNDIYIERYSANSTNQISVTTNQLPGAVVNATILATGASGGSTKSSISPITGNSGSSGTGGQTGGGGSGSGQNGGANFNYGNGGAGAAGTAYSGGAAGGSGGYNSTTTGGGTNGTPGGANGGAGGNAGECSSGGASNTASTGGAGNPSGANAAQTGQLGQVSSSQSITGGIIVLTVFGSITNNGTISTNGGNGGFVTNNGTIQFSIGGSGSGAGGLIVFCGSLVNNGTISSNGGLAGHGSDANGAPGGSGSINIQQLAASGNLI